MQDKLIIATRVKKTIEYIEKAYVNCPHTETIIKNKILSSSYDLLKYVYQANIHKSVDYMKDVIVEIRMIEYYTKISYDKKIISLKKYENIGKHLLEINNMVLSWINYEKSK